MVGIAGAAARSRSGTITYVSVAINNGRSVDIATGVIGDHGTDRPGSNSAQKIVLSKGTFAIDTTKFNKSFRFRTDPKRCTGIGMGSASNLPISHGTGAYAGISGSISVKAMIAETAIMKNGKCQILQGKSSAAVSSFTGTGHVSY